VRLAVGPAVRSRKLRALGGLVGLLAAALPGASAAQSARPAPGSSDLPDTVELADGGFLRGVIVELDPREKIVIQLPTGELRRVPVGDVRAATRAGQPVRLGTPGAAASPAPAPAAPSAAPGASGELEQLWSAVPGPRVRIDAAANRTALLQRRIGADDEDGIVAYHVVCVLPCAVSVPARDPQPYRIGGYRTQPTPWFNAPSHDAVLRARLVRDSWPLWPRATLFGGLLFGALGGAIVGGNAIGPGKPWLRNTGLAFGGLGAGMLVSSAILYLVRPETSYTLEPAR
jgi:hypothetical protein